MKQELTLRMLLSDYTFFFPEKNRFYTWQAPTVQGDQDSMAELLFSLLHEQFSNITVAPYYAGHFIFQKSTEGKFFIVNGLQRITTFTILLNEIFKCLKTKRPLNESEEIFIKNTIKVHPTDRFVHCFKDSQSLNNISKVATFFSKKISDKDESFLTKMVEIISNAVCTTYVIEGDNLYMLKNE